MDESASVSLKLQLNLSKNQKQLYLSYKLNIYNDTTIPLEAIQSPPSLFTNPRGEHRPPVTSSGRHGKHIRLLVSSCGRLQGRQHSHPRGRRCTSMGKRSGKLHSDDGDWSPMASRPLLTPGTGQLTFEHPSQATVEELCPLPAETDKTGSGQVP